MSNLLRHRLAARPRPDTHPDPDILTAFAEQALPAGERSSVVRHLADCAYCREIVALSFPELEQQPVTVAAPSKPGFWLPVLKWGVLAAAMIVAMVLLPLKLRQGGGQQPANFAQKEPVSQPAAAPTGAASTDRDQSATTAKDQMTTAVATTPAAANSEPRRSAGPASQKTASPAATSRAVGGTATAHNMQPAMPQQSHQSNEFDRENSKLADVAAATAAPASTVSNGAMAGGGRTETKATDAVTTAAESVPSAPAPPPAKSQVDARLVPQSPKIQIKSLPDQTLNFQVEAPKKEVAAVPARESSLAKSKGAFTSFAGKVASAMRARNTGGPSQSLAGNLINNSNQAANNADANQLVPVWKISPDGKLVKSDNLVQWHEAYPNSQELRLRVVVTDGQDVWAGGNRLTIIHSWNGGQNWKKLELGQADSGDISAIEIDDGKVQVKTTNGQTFVSSDGGTTWVPLKQDPK